MTSHLHHMQYQKQRINDINQFESSSSLPSQDYGQANSAYQLNENEQNISLVSGSNISSKVRSQLGSVGNTYQNIVKSSRLSKQPSYVISNENIHNDLFQKSGSKKHLGSITSNQPSTMFAKSTQGSRSIYLPSQFRMSRSLKASKASLATYKSGRSTIQAEHHDRKVQRKINSVKFGNARKLYWISVGFFIMFLIVLFLGLLITCLRHIYMNIILSLDIGEMFGPLLIACSFLFFGAGLKFYYDAYKLGCKERQRLIYKAASPSTVAITTTNKKLCNKDEKLVSGGTSQNALVRAPIGSRSTLFMP